MFKINVRIASKKIISSRTLTFINLTVIKDRNPNLITKVYNTDEEYRFTGKTL